MTQLQSYYAAHKDAGFFHHAIYRLSKDCGYSAPSILWSLSDINTRLARQEGKYILFIPVLSHSLERWGQHNPIHQLPLFVRDDINNSKAVLVLDYSNEAGSEQLIDVIEKSAVDIGISNLLNVILLAQNRLLDSNLSKIRFFSFDFFPLISFLHLKKHATEEYSAKLDAAIQGQLKREKLVMCLNATPRTHRLMACAMLEYHGLLVDSIVSFPGRSYGKGGQTDWDSILQKWKKSKLEYLVSPAIKILDTSPYKVDNFSEIGNALVNKIHFEHYINSWVSLVTETGVNTGIRRITEKTFQAAGLGHPFLIFGHPASIQMVKEFGFSAYESIINSSYDEIDDPALRLEALMTSLDDYLRKIDANDKYTIGQTLEISRSNRDWLRYGFLNLYIRNYITPINQYIQNRLSVN